MRVSLLHSKYSTAMASGENSAVLQQYAELKSRGIDVDLWECSTDELSLRRGHRVRVASRLLTGIGSKENFPACESAEHILHVHNTFPNYRWKDIESWPGPIVMTIHNHRLSCPIGTHIRDGRECFECNSGAMWPAVVHGCYRKSRVASLPAAVATADARRRALGRVDQFVVQAEYLVPWLQQQNVDLRRIHVVPGPISASPYGYTSIRDSNWLLVARATEEKGIPSLVAQWPADRRLIVVGDGPELSRAKERAPGSVIFLGELPNGEVRRRLSASSGLVLSSIGREGAIPLTVREALAAGTPIVARAGTDLGIWVREVGAGACFAGPDELQAAVDTIVEDWKKYSHAALLISRLFDPEIWFEGILTAYSVSLASRQRRNS